MYFDLKIILWDYNGSGIGRAPHIQYFREETPATLFLCHFYTTRFCEIYLGLIPFSRCF